MSTKPNTSQITYDTGTNKQDLNNILDTIVPIADYTVLRNYTGRATQVRITADGIAGSFKLVTTGVDNGGTVIRQGSTVDSSGVITQGTGSKIWERVFDGAVNVKWFGATGNGTANDTIAIQAAIDSLSATGGVVYFHRGEYRVDRNTGVNDRWGIKVTGSNITLRGDKATLRRFNTNISTYSLAYPIIFVGTPDSNVAAATENVAIEGFKFQGENTQHSSGGSALKDFRDAIHAKNTKNLVVQNNTFTAIDSAVITYQAPAAYDYANAVYYNTTKNYNSKFINNTCIANSHAVAGRGLIHAVTAIGVDNLLVDGNYFEWCDDAVASDTTYDLGKVETDTFTPVVSGWSLGAVKRTGCGVVVSNNIMHNCSEHPVYVTGFEEIVSANKITSDQPTITATNDPIKIRSYGCVISGNFISGYGSAITCAPGALNVSITGNTIYISSSASFDLGAISVNSAGLSAYLAPRIAMGFLSGYRQMSGFTISGNSVNFQEAAVSPANTRRDVAFNVLSSTSDANYPNGQLVGVSISGNTVKNYQVGVHVTGLMFKSVAVSGNAFFAKPFTEAAFNGSTTMNTRCVVQVSRDSTTQLFELSFSGNSIYGGQYLWASRDGGGSAGTIYHPTLFNDNSLRFIQNTGTADFIQLGASPAAKFNNNTGIYFLGRSWGGYALGNNLYSDQGNTDNQARKQSFVFLGGNLRFYTDDAGTFLTL